jgi:hypothetical protein
MLTGRVQNGGDSRFGGRKAVWPRRQDIDACDRGMEELRHHDNCAQALPGRKNSGMVISIAFWVEH